MIINEIIQNDLMSCDEAIQADSEINDIEKRLSNIIKEFDDSISNELEDLFISIMRRTESIAYLQGIKDFCTLFVDLKEDASTLLKRVEDE